MVVANPPPTELAFTADELEQLLEQALGEARRQEVAGSEETPFLLRQLALLSAGRTVALNEALVLAS